VKNLLALISAAFFAGCVLTACQTAPAPVSSPGGMALTTRNNCYSLLHQLLDDQKDVSILRFIKRENSDVKDLVKKIASASGAGAKLLEEFAKNDPMVNLDATLLPPGETATRDAIASTKKDELLTQSGDEFELTLLLTQTEALSYAWHLAQVASENDSQPDRARALAGISKDMKNLYQEVFTLLLSKTKSSATRQITAR
jgi:hypothetical protein